MSVRAALVAAVAILAAYNVARGFGVFGQVTGLAAVGIALLMLVIARCAGLGAGALGLATTDLPRGARYGGVTLALTVVVLVTVAAIPATSGYLNDSRADLSLPGLLSAVVVSTLIVTVIPEELAFRGLLLGAGIELWTERRAVLVCSVLFGLWHISPTLGTMSSNHETAGASASVAGAFGVVAGSVAATFVAGVVFCWLRLRSRSLLAPVLAHLGTNGTAFVVAWFVVRSRG